MIPKLFVISNSNDIAKIGKAFPQVDGMGNTYNLNKKNSLSDITNYKYIDFVPDLDYFKISNSAKLTDFISTGLISAPGFLVSERVKQILDHYVITQHVYYPARVKFKMDFYENYYWLHFTKTDDELIKFVNSSFILTHPLPFFRKEQTDLTFADLKEAILCNQKNNTQRLFPKEFCLRNNKQDFYSFSFLSNNHYLSDTMVKHLTNENITGFDIRKAYL